MKRRIVAAPALAALMLIAACGGSDGGDAATTEAPAAEPAATEAAEPAATEAAEPPATEAAAEEPAATEATEEEPAAPSGESKPATGGEGCGLNNGEAASGDPIKVGAVFTVVPGIDFSGGGAAQQAYYDCVNANGGINGRPIELIIENDNLKPEDAGAAARKLIETDKVVMMAGGFSILDCPVNGPYYAEQGYNVMVAGVPAECFSSPNIAAVNMGPAYSTLGAAQSVVAKGAKGTMVLMTNKAPGSAYNGSLAALYAEQNGIKTVSIETVPPIADPAAEIRAAVEAAGEGGSIVVTYTPPEGLALLKAAEEQGLIDKVTWGSATPLNDNSVAAALGEAWAGKLNVNAELSLLDDDRPEMDLYREVLAEYAPDQPSGSFQQMGFLLGRLSVHALLSLDPADVDDPAKVNEAVLAIKNFNTDILCKPWYFGGLPGGNVPNNWDYNVVPNGTDIMELDTDCFEIAAVEPVLQAVRKAEKELGLNVG